MSDASSPLEDLLASFWAAVDGRALGGTLQRSAASSAFLSSLLESLVFLTRRIIRDSSGKSKELLLTSKDAKHVKEIGEVLDAQMKRVWEELKEGNLKMDKRVASGMVASKGLVALREVEPGKETFNFPFPLTLTDYRTLGLFEGAWQTLASCMRNQGQLNADLTATFVKTFKFDERLKLEGAVLQRDVVVSASQKACSNEDDSKDAQAMLFEMMRAFGSSLFEEPEIAQVGFLHLEPMIINIDSSILSHCSS